jgi:hypothetical protein
VSRTPWAKATNATVGAPSPRMKFKPKGINLEELIAPTRAATFG